MADKADVILEENTVRIRSTGESPVLDIEGGNHWNLSKNDGDVRIGDAENMLKMGVAKGGGGAGNARIWATADLKLGSSGESVVSIDDQGVHPHGDGYALGRPDDRWFTANIGILDVENGVSSDLLPFYFDTPDDNRLDLGSDGARWGTLWTDEVDANTITTDSHLNVGEEIYCDGNLRLTGDGGTFTGRAIVQQLSVSEGSFTITPLGSGQDLGAEDAAWDTLYVKNIPSQSDRRLKTDIEEVEGGLDAVLGLRPVSYSWRDNGDDTQLGLIGQEVADVLPEVVTIPDDDEGYLGVDYTELVAVLVDAVQEQHADNEALEERVERQQEHIEDQQERIDDLEARLVALEEAS